MNPMKPKKLFGEIVIEMKLAKPAQINEALAAQKALATGEKPTKKKTVPKEPLGLRPADLVGLGFLFAVVGLVLSAFFIKVP